MIKWFLIGLLVVSNSLAGRQAAAQESIPAINKRYQLLKNHRARLEKLLSSQVQQINRLKHQPRGVRRDFQLQRALRDNQQLAGKLTQIQSQLRKINEKLLKAIDSAIANATDDKGRRKLAKLRNHLLKERTAGPMRIVTLEKALPLDSTEDLEEKADLLKDSEEKIQREVKRLETQISRLLRREKLRRYSRAANDSPFIEDSPRRYAQVNTKLSLADGKKTNTSNDTQSAGDAREDDKVAPSDHSTPPVSGGSGYNEASNSPSASNGAGAAPAPPSNNKSTDVGAENEPAPNAPANFGTTPTTPAPAPASSSPTYETTTEVTIRNVLDPETLAELGRARKTGNLKARIAALQKAKDKLKQMAKKLSSQAQDLRRRAKHRHEP